MTLGMAWVRETGSIRELVIISDSRLSGGQSWDGNPKILMLPRSDAVISFAGSTNFAYPLMLQAYNAVNMYPRSKSRALDITELKGHFIRIFNGTLKSINNFPVGQLIADNPDAFFLLCGYSWKFKTYKIWTLHYDDSIKEFTFRPTSDWGGQDGDAKKMIAFVGDKDAVTKAKEKLVLLLKETGKISTGSLDMEPFEILRDTIRSTEFTSVGGPPQIVKIYEHANAVPVGVYWPTKESNQVCVLGRPLLGYEKFRDGIIDPDSPNRAFPQE